MSYTFETTVSITLDRAPLTLLAIAAEPALDEDSLDPNEEIEIDVSVKFDPGWFHPGRFSGPPEDCYPDEGEDPEILSVKVITESGKGEDIFDLLSSYEVSRLVEAAWEHQQVEQEALAEAAAEARYDEMRDGECFDDY